MVISRLVDVPAQAPTGYAFALVVSVLSTLSFVGLRRLTGLSLRGIVLRVVGGVVVTNAVLLAAIAVQYGFGTAFGAAVVGGVSLAVTGLIPLAFGTGVLSFTTDSRTALVATVSGWPVALVVPAATAVAVGVPFDTWGVTLTFGLVLLGPGAIGYVIHRVRN